MVIIVVTVGTIQRNPMKLLICLAFHAIWQPQVIATTVLKTNLTELTKTSEHVVAGQVISQTAKWDSDGKMISTYSDVQVDQVVRGKLVQSKYITIVQPGGVIGDTAQVVHGMTLLRRYDKILLFLNQSLDSHGDTVHKINGLTQGLFHLQRNSRGQMMAVPAETPTLAPKLDQQQGKLQSSDALSSMPYTTLLEQVRAIP